jgi:hypothetical protein
MIEIIDTNDSRAVRNKNNVLALYDLMINTKKSEEGTARFVSPAYIQHNPRPNHAGTRPGPRRRPPHHRGGRLCMGARQLSESLQ